MRSSPSLAPPPTATLEVPLVFDAVTVERQRVPVLRGLDLQLEPGESVGIVGANGAGKTTLLHLAASLRRPTAGGARILGTDLRRPLPAGLRRAICLVGHESALYPLLTLRENLRFTAVLSARSEQAAEMALVAVGLARVADRRVAHCSEGMIRRADLARALLAQPRLLLLDEPHAGLDDSAASLVDHLVADTRSRGGGALVVSHDRGRLACLVDRMLLLEDGKLSEPGARG